MFQTKPLDSYSFLAKKSLIQSWRARIVPFELALCPASTKWEVVGISSFSSWATNSRANLSGHTSSPTPWTTQVLIGPVGPSFSFLTSSTKVSGSSNVPLKNRRVSKKDTEVVFSISVSEIWKITKWSQLTILVLLGIKRFNDFLAYLQWIQ